MLANANGTAYHNITTYQYDRGGNLTRTATLINQQFHARQWAETVNTFRHNRLVSTRTGGTAANTGITTEYTYDLAGNILTKRVGHPASPATMATTTYAYDTRGRLIRVTDALGQAETITYDQNSLRLTSTDRNGTQFRYIYDNMGRITNRQAWVGGVLQIDMRYVYYRTGALFWNSNGHHTVFRNYDAQGRIIQIDETAGVTHVYTYNVANNIVNFSTIVNGRVHVLETHHYDIAQRVVQITTAAGWGVLAYYTYDANGNRTSATLRNGVRTDYTFSPGNLVTSVVNSLWGTVLSRFDYTYFLDGNVMRVVETYQNASLNRTVTYTYDLARRLTREQVTGSGALIRDFAYDARGNRASMTVTGSATNHTVTYAYDLNNRLLTETRTGSGAQTTHFAYDRNGNLLTSTTGVIVETRTYNAFNQLTHFTRPGVTAIYAYRSDGLRRYRTVNGQRVEQLWNRGQLSLEFNASRQLINRFYRGLQVNHLIGSAQHGFYLYNARGDVVQRIDDRGNLLATYRYDAFGTEVAPEGGNNPFRFAGQYWDWERGEYYLRARSFNPRLGRFTQPDPFWNVGNMQRSRSAILQSNNLFVYTMNNPVMFVDPSGMVAVIPHPTIIQSLTINRGPMLSPVMQAGMSGTIGFAAAFTVGTPVGFVAGGSSGSTAGGSGGSTASGSVTKVSSAPGGGSGGGNGGGSILTPSQVAAGFEVAVVGGNTFINITTTLTARMHETIREGRAHGVRAVLPFMWFYSQVNHDGPWNIKEEPFWNATLGSNTFPGDDAIVYFSGMLFTPPALGNFTYGYIGRGVGFSLPILAAGSVYAEFTDAIGNRFIPTLHDVGTEFRGQYYITRGYLHHLRHNPLNRIR